MSKIKIKVLYSKKLPIPGNKYANETYQAELETETDLVHAGAWASCFADVRKAVDAEFSANRTEMKATHAEPPTDDKNRPDWMKDGPDPEASEWVGKYAELYENVPANLEPPTVKQIAYIENLMYDMIIPAQDKQALDYFAMLESGIMDKETAKSCIDYLLKNFKWQPRHKQRGKPKGKKQ